MSDAIRRYWSDMGAVMLLVLPKTQLHSFRGTVMPGTVPIGDAGGVLHEWFATQEGDGSIVLMRPDRVVAGIVPPQQLDEASRTLRGMIGGRFALEGTVATARAADTAIGASRDMGCAA